MKLRIGILGTRGIPNHYGGFEQFASFLSGALALRGHEVMVYNPHTHPCKEKKWENVQRVTCYDPSSWMGTAGQFLYDLFCIRDAAKRSLDILLILGYTSSSVWGRWYPEKTVIITNMDGLEWKRSKYPPMVQRFLRYAEKLAMRYSDHTVADAVPVLEYLQDKYGDTPVYIAYAAEPVTVTNETIPAQYGVYPHEYFLLIARMEPENHIDEILEGLLTDTRQRSILVVGSTDNAYGKKMRAKYGTYPQVLFTGAIYRKEILDALRSYCCLYLHGHSVGGTNPSLLEAMACGALICAHDNVFNRAVTGEDALYFQTAEDIAQLVNGSEYAEQYEPMQLANLQKIAQHYNPEKIADGYESLFIGSLKTKK